MSTVCAYFLFNGNCLEAMRFYKDCLGGELRIQSLGDHPTTVFPDTMNKLVLQAVLSGEHFRIYGSDLNGSHQIKQGTAMNLFMDLSSEEELFRTYEKLTQKGT